MKHSLLNLVRIPTEIAEINSSKHAKYCMHIADWSLVHHPREDRHIIEPWHGIFNNVACATSKASDQPAHTRSLIRAFASRLNIL